MLKNTAGGTKYSLKTTYSSVFTLFVASLFDFVSPCVCTYFTYFPCEIYLKSLSGSSLNQKAGGLIPVVFGQEKKVLVCMCVWLGE